MPASTEPAPPRVNHVFVDFENVHQCDTSLIGAKAVNFTFLLGANQTRVDVGLVEKLMAHAASVQLIRLTSSGRNALDFALAYYVGRAVSANPAASIHIVSQDKGFDPLVEHLRSRNVLAHRHDSFATLTFPGAARTAAAPPEATAGERQDPLAGMLERLRKNAASRPKKKATLLSYLKSSLGKEATAADAAAMLEQLRRAGHLSIGEKDRVAYRV